MDTLYFGFHRLHSVYACVVLGFCVCVVLFRAPCIDLVFVHAMRGPCTTMPLFERRSETYTVAR